MDDYLENLTGAIHIEGSAELMAELREARAASKKAAGADDALKSRLSPVAESVAAIARTASICNPLKPCAVAVSEFHGYEAPARAEREEIKIPFYDWQAAIERHRDHVRAEATETARLSEIARLKARDDYEASKRSMLQASPEPVQAMQVEMETPEQRQERRYQMCIDAGLKMPDNDYATLPRGVGELAKREGITRPAFTEDVKKHINRLNRR